MRKRNFTLRMALLSAAMTILFINPIFSQQDILDVGTLMLIKDDCLTDDPLLIPFNFDASGTDSILVISNFSGYRNYNTLVTDKQYKFCAPNWDMCSASGSSNGEFHLRFTDNLGNPINDMYRVTFIIKTN
ncbi:MAG: hypothetical protein JXB49_36610, partial [Bacteroidales bacterium]|nr:hypothetical protein [Bacteroidales bacterium]